MSSNGHGAKISEIAESAGSMDEASTLCGLDLSKPELFSKLLEQRSVFPPQTEQGDVLQFPSLSVAQLKDTSTGFTLPPVKLGPQTDLAGHPGYNKQTTIEYTIHFSLPSDAQKRLSNIVNLLLTEAFRNNDKDLQKHIAEAYEQTPENEYDMALRIFLSKARLPWQDDGSVLIKERTTVKESRPVSICSAEGVDHSGRLKVLPGSVVRPYVRIVTWAINGIYGASMKLSDKGLMVYRCEGPPVSRQHFLPGDFYLCVRPDETLEIRDACGAPMRIKFPLNIRSDTSLFIDDTMRDDIHAMEEKIQCPASCVSTSVEGKPFITFGDSLPAASAFYVCRPTVVMNKSWRTLRWEVVMDN